ncbi:hypothetical protein K440DRAFT_135854 [Wilcoxina mikolae CBS 423.85]|nr:hypothetical protein K440DRAFT_135854 [Wilcoxina mikolae CBS 423.85]
MYTAKHVHMLRSSFFNRTLHLQTLHQMPNLHLTPLNSIPALTILLIHLTNAETPPSLLLQQAAAESTAFTITTILGSPTPAAPNDKQTTVTITHILYPTSSPLPEIFESGMYTHHIYLILLSIFFLASAYLISHALWYLFEKFRWKWVHGVRYERELRAARMEVGESAAWSDAGSVERAVYRAGVRERMGVWWRSDRGSAGREMQGRTGRFSGFEREGSGRERGSVGRRGGEEV